MSKLQLSKELIENGHQLILVSGKKGSGKSYLIKGIVYMLAPRFEDVLVISPSVYTGYEYVPDEKKHFELTKELVESIKETQQNNGMKPLLLIIDDATGMKLNSGSMQQFITTSRHLGVTIVFAAHGINKFPTTVQESALTAFVFKTMNNKEIKALYEVLLSDFDSKDEASRFFKEKTKEKYQFLMVRNYEHERGRYESAKMPELPDFKLEME